MEHGDVEKLISEEGNELLRRLLQGHFNLRTSREAKLEEVTGSDGVVHTRCREGCERTLMSLFGEVVLKRKGYAAPGVAACFRWMRSSICRRTNTRTVCGNGSVKRWLKARSMRR